MRTFEFTVRDPVGIHARPAGLLAKKAKEFACEIVIKKDEKTAVATRLMAVMGLCVKGGDRITVTLSGADEDIAAEAMQRFFEENL